MVAEEIVVTLSGGAPWGFRLQGGAELQKPLQVAKVRRRSKACRAGLREHDELVSIDDQMCSEFSHAQAMNLIDAQSATLSLRVKRAPAGFHSSSYSGRSASPRSSSMRVLPPPSHPSILLTPRGITSPPDSEAYYGETDSDADTQSHTHRRQRRTPPHARSPARYDNEEEETSEMSGYESATDGGVSSQGQWDAQCLPGVPRRELIYQPVQTEWTTPAHTPHTLTPHSLTPTPDQMLAEAEGEGDSGFQEAGGCVGLTCPPLVSPERAREALMLGSSKQLVPMVGPQQTPLSDELSTTYMDKARQAKLQRGESVVEKQVKEARTKCRSIASLLTDAPNPNSKGVLMFKKRRQRAKKYTLTCFGKAEGEGGAETEGETGGETEEEGGSSVLSGSEVDEEGFSGSFDPTWDSGYLDVLDRRSSACPSTTPATPTTPTTNHQGPPGLDVSAYQSPGLVEAPGLESLAYQSCGVAKQPIAINHAAAAAHNMSPPAVALTNGGSVAVSRASVVLSPPSQTPLPSQNGQHVHANASPTTDSIVDHQHLNAGGFGPPGVLNRTARPFTPGPTAPRASVTSVMFRPPQPKPVAAISMVTLSPTRQQQQQQPPPPPPSAPDARRAVSSTSLYIPPRNNNTNSNTHPPVHSHPAVNSPPAALAPPPSLAFSPPHAFAPQSAVHAAPFSPPTPQSPAQPFSPPAPLSFPSPPAPSYPPPSSYMSAPPLPPPHPPAPTQVSFHAQPAHPPPPAPPPPLPPAIPPSPSPSVHPYMNATAPGPHAAVATASPSPQVPVAAAAASAAVPADSSLATREQRISVPAARTGILSDARRRSTNKKPMFCAVQNKDVSVNPDLLSMVQNMDDRFTRPAGAESAVAPGGGGHEAGGHESGPEEDWLRLGAEACNFMQAQRGPRPPPVAPKPQSPTVPQLAGKGGQLFARRQSRMDRYVVERSPSVAAAPYSPAQTREPSPTPSLPAAWKYSSNIRAPPPISYNPLLSPSCPLKAQKKPEVKKAGTAGAKGKKGGMKPEDIMSHQPYQLNSTLFSYGGGGGVPQDNRQQQPQPQRGMAGAPQKTARVYEVKRFSTPPPVATGPALKVIVPRSATTLGEPLWRSDVASPPLPAMAPAPYQHYQPPPPQPHQPQWAAAPLSPPVMPPAPNAPLPQLPTFSVPAPKPTHQPPTFSQPTFSQPTFSQPTFSQPTFSQPTFSPPTFSHPSAAQANRGFKSAPDLSPLSPTATAQPVTGAANGPRVPRPRFSTSNLGLQPCVWRPGSTMH